MYQVKRLMIVQLMSMLLILNSHAAAIEAYQFDDKEKSVRFQKLVAELRCPKCQNQNIADSNSEIAHDLRNKIQTLLIANKSDDDIVQYMVDRYGDFVLYDPKITGQTYLLWFGPFLLLLIGLVIVFFIVRLRQKRETNKIQSDLLNTDQQHQLDDLLNQNKD